MRGFRAYIGHTVIISAADFHVKGRLTGMRGDVLVLQHAVHLETDPHGLIDGTLLIPASVVQYVQVP